MIKNQQKYIKKYNKSNLICNSNRSFHIYYNINKLDNLSFKSKYSQPVEFFNDLENCDKLDRKKESTNTRQLDVYNTAPELYNQLLQIYFNQYSDFSHA